MFLLAATGALMMNMAVDPWVSINDSVMGGVSTGGMHQAGEGLHFRGNLSLQNNGGFSSVRRLASEDFTKSKGIRLTVKGDGRNYQFRLRQDKSFDGVAWRKEFSTDGSVQVFEFTFDQFEPVFRGRLVRNAGPVKPDLISQIGFLIADKNEAPFSLQVFKIDLLGQGENPP
jgi:hypothetical protein